MFHAIPYAEEFAVKKRALDVALKGHSNVKQPKRKNGAISVRTTSYKSNAKSSSQLIMKTMQEQRHQLEGLDESIHTEITLVKSLLTEHSDHGSTDDNMMVPDTLKPEVLNIMRSIKFYQKEYVRVLRVMEGIKVIEVAVQDGFLDPRKVAKCLNEILKVTWKSRAHSQSQKIVASDAKLLHQLQQQEFFPYLKSKHPGKVFFRSEKPKSPEELHQTKGSNGSTPSVTDSNSMPALSSICSESVVTTSVFGDSQYSASCYAPSEVSSAPNSPTYGSNRNKHFPGFAFASGDISGDVPDFYSRDTLIPALALQFPETTVLDFLSPTIEIVPKDRPSRWGTADDQDLSSNKPQQLSGSSPHLTTTKVDTAPSNIRDSLPTRPPSFAKRTDSFCLEEKCNSSFGGMDEFQSLDCIPNMPARRGSGDSTCRTEERDIDYEC
mmetsp:Transcript_39543/g.95615  ORF Transcript_39543/g.95615 Transcript_39543/m.95615 type:complete len:437 (+) Transcript_39543:173-1483(+)